MSASSAVPHNPLGWDDAFLAKYDTIVFDCDGVIWRGNHFLPGMVETLKKLVSLGKTVVYCSNNSTKSRKDFVDKFASAGVPVARSHVYSSSSTIASLLLATPGFDAAAHKVFTIGFTGLREELRERGIQVVDSNDVAPPSLGMAGLSAAAPDPAVRAVVVGLDPSMTYTKAAYATILLLERDCLFFRDEPRPHVPWRAADPSRRWQLRRYGRRRCVARAHGRGQALTGHVRSHRSGPRRCTDAHAHGGRSA